MILKLFKNNRGQILVQALVYGSIAVVMIGGLISWAAVNIQASRLAVKRELVLQIAESGADYYRWHLAHAASDYTDGTTTPAPYVHNFYDKDDNLLGTFALTITPPATGTTVVIVKSKGTLASDPTVSRTVQVKFAIPSFAKFAVVANDNLRFGAGTETFGPVHSNGGIRFDGLAHNVITSAQASYDDPDHSGGSEFGVHTHVNAPPSSGVNDTYRAGEAPPSTLASRPDVFIAGRLFPVPAVDFVGLTTNLSQMKTLAQTAGKYISSSGAQGYHIIFKTNGTYDLYKVTNLQSAPNGCANDLAQTNWGTWSIKSVGGQALVGNYANPSNGIIFVEDNLWVDGQVNTARVTVAAGRFPDNPGTRPAITVNTDLLYSHYDGSDVLALISQGDINVGLYSDDNLEIDAALVAQNGRAGRDYYSSSCGSNYVRSVLTLYGMIGSNLRYGFAYTDGTGYGTRNITYDGNLLYGPPPSFPLTSDQYSIISWQEVK